MDIALSPPSIDLAFAPPPRDLEPFVSGFVERIDSGTFSTMRELPAPMPLLQIMLGGPVTLMEAGEPVAVPRVALWGPAAEANEVRSDRPMHAFVVILTMAGAARLAPTLPLAGRRIATEDLSLAGSSDIAERLEAAPGLARKAAVVADWLRPLFARAGEIDRDLGLMDAVLAHRFRGTVSGLARQAGLSERGFNKRCHRLVGWSPKQLLRIARLQRVLRTLHPRPWPGGWEEDARAEFTDDSHLARDFLDLTGVTVADYRRAKHRSGDLLFHSLVG